MKYFVFLFGLIVSALTCTAYADQVLVNFCVDADMDDWCDQEFTSFVEHYGLTDMELLEIALEDELMVDDWDEYLWAVTIEGYDYDFLPQFDGAEPVTVYDGDEVFIWFTGWQLYSTGGLPSIPGASGMSSSGGFSGSGSGSGSSGSGASMPGSIPSGSTQVTAVSGWLTGYSVEVDGFQIGVEGTGSDPADGVYTFYVAGNQQHDIKINHPQFWKSWQDFFMAGRSYTANIDVPGRVVLSG